MGDRVVIHLNSFGTDPRGKPFEVTLTKVDYEANFDRRGLGRPIVHWEARPGINDMAFCDSSYVMEIVERAPHKTPAVKKNSLVVEQGFHDHLLDKPRSRSCIAASPVGVAKLILSQMPELNIPYGIVDRRITDEWYKAGALGLKGRYDYRTESVIPRYDRPEEGAKRLFEALRMPWIHVDQFKSWLLRRLPHLIRTKAEFRADMAESVRMDEKTYARDLGYGSNDDDYDPPSYYED